MESGVEASKVTHLTLMFPRMQLAHIGPLGERVAKRLLNHPCSLRRRGIRTLPLPRWPIFRLQTVAARVHRCTRQDRIMVCDCKYWRGWARACAPSFHGRAAASSSCASFASSASTTNIH